MSKILSVTIDSSEFDRLEEIERQFNELTKLFYANDPCFVTVTMIANASGMSRQEALNRPWMLPRFGRVEDQDKSNRKRFWRFDEYLDWVAIPVEERKKMYRKFINEEDS